MGGLLGAYCAGLTGGVRKTQLRRLVTLPLDAKGLKKELPRGPWGHGNLEDLLKNLWKAPPHLKCSLQPGPCGNTPDARIPYLLTHGLPFHPRRGLKSQLLCKEEVPRREQRAEELHTHFPISELKSAKVEGWKDPTLS